MALLAIVLISTVGMGSAYAVTSAGTWNTYETNTQRYLNCGTNLTDSKDYSCAEYQKRYNTVNILAKSATGGPGVVVESNARVNADQSGWRSTIGAAPEITTYKNNVTFTSVWDLEGDIYEENSERSTSYLNYGHQVWKKTWFGWSDVSTVKCVNLAYDNVDGKKTVQCTINNSGTNTYRISGVVDAIVSQTWPNAGISYVDFYTGNNHAKLLSLKIS